MMKYLQKLGKALMLPVAALPVAGILMGVGYLLAPGVMAFLALRPLARRTPPASCSSRRAALSSTTWRGSLPSAPPSASPTTTTAPRAWLASSPS